MSAEEHDTWHQHTDAEGAPQREHGAHASPKALGITLILMVLGVLFTIIILKVYFDSYMSSYESKVEDNTVAARATWEWKQDIFNNMAPSVAKGTDAVIAEYAKN